jgi:hypothetical protein
MPDPLDAYADNISITLTPYGANLSFLVSPPHQDPSKPTPPTPVATIRMSVEHAKVMVLVMKRYIQSVEQQSGVEARVSAFILNQLGMSLEDWDSFWKPRP